MKRVSLTLMVLCLSLITYAQFDVKGKIVDQEKNPISWVMVKMKNTNLVSYSNLDGEFSFKNAPSGSQVLTYSLIGFETIEEQISISNNINDKIIILRPNSRMIDEIAVIGTRATVLTPIAYSDISEEQIEEVNFGQDIPYILNQSTSVVSSSDGGAGIGYTGIRIRGTDLTRINVTVNGIPLNDAESHGVFWVNMPDFASNTENIQIQRGAGTSTNGAAAFGASINLLTNTLKEEAYGEVNNSFGSFNTIKNTLKFGSGLINNHFTFDGRLSRLKSDGYIDRASADLKSFYLSGAYIDDKQSLRMNVFSGQEKTYQSWYGTPKEKLEEDAQGIQDYIAFNGLNQEQTDNILNSDRRYNHYLYDNEVDNYGQDHYQLFYNRQVEDNLFLNIGLHYTKGEGYFEQFKEGEDLSDYGLNPVITPNDTIESTDLIRRRWLDNDFYGVVFSTDYRQSNKLNVKFGGGFNVYEGKHFGEVIWAQFASNSDIRHNYYDNDARKTDFNVYTKLNYQFSNKLNGFLDLQLRSLTYSFLGFDEQLNNVTQNDNLEFFNPKLGFVYSINSRSRVYGSFAVANKEPNRDDYTESSSLSRPKHETLNDFELGYKMNSNKVGFGSNLYFMAYENQLVPTGQINDVGASVRTNIPSSYRAGLEIETSIMLHKSLNLIFNASFSQNKIKEWTEYVDNWDTWGKDTITYKNTDIAFSPNILVNSILEFSPLKLLTNKKKDQDLKLSLITKYVGEQYIDNTSSKDRVLDAYLVNDLRLNYSINFKKLKELNIGVGLYNVFSELYSSNAWVYRFSLGGDYRDLNGYFPQATRNILINVGLKF